MRILFSAIADDAEVVFGDTVRAVIAQDDARVGVEFERGSPREVDVVVGADGQHSALRELVFGPERQFTRHLGAYLSIFTVDNLLELRDRAVLYNEPGRATAMFTVRGNQRAKVVLLFRSNPLDIDFTDPVAQQELLRRCFAGMGWEAGRLLAAMPDAYDFYFDEMSQVRLPSWSTGRVALLGEAAFGPSPMSGPGHLAGVDRRLSLAHHIATAADLPTAFTLWERGFRPNVELNQSLATAGCRHCCLIPGSASLPATSRCGCCRCWPGMAAGSGVVSNALPGPSHCPTDAAAR